MFTEEHLSAITILFLHHLCDKEQYYRHEV